MPNRLAAARVSTTSLPVIDVSGLASGNAAERQTDGAALIAALQDRSIHRPLQRKLQELVPPQAVYALDSDHAPQLSHRDQLAALFLDIVGRHARDV